MRKLLFLLLFLNISSVYSQRTNGIQFIATPYIQEVGNLNKRYTIIGCETIFTKHKRFPSAEFGLLYHHNFKKKMGWGIGVTWKHAQFETETRFTRYQFPDQNLMRYYNYVKASYVNIKFQLSRQINDKLKINYFLTIESPFSVKETDVHMNASFWINDFIDTPGGLVPVTVQHNDIRIWSSFGWFNFVPEINASYELYKNLNLSLGFRFKFWKTEPNMQIKVEGYNGIGNSDELIYHYEVDNREYSFNVGLMYELKYDKRVK